MFKLKYKNMKDQRKEYYDSRRFDHTCRNHGSCSYCSKGRQHNSKRRKPIEEDQDE